MTDDLAATQTTRAVNLKNKPSDSAWRQQKLKGIRPILTASTALPVTFSSGCIFLPLGILLFLANKSVVELQIDYTHCKSNFTGPNGTQLTAYEALMKGHYDCHLICDLNLQLEQDMPGRVEFYYGLSQFYQNNRRYVKSRNELQLAGKNVRSVSECDPYTSRNSSIGLSEPFAPCGAVANSMFNDSFTLYYLVTDGTNIIKRPVNMTTKGLIWEAQRKAKFKNPEHSGDLCDAFKGTARPVDWQRSPCQLSTDLENNGFENVDFIAWMNIAALPTFRKMYRLLDQQTEPFRQGLSRSYNYSLTIEYNYPVHTFDGQKRFILTTRSWAGTKNYFLAITCIALALFLFFFSAVFLFIHFKYKQD